MLKKIVVAGIILFSCNAALSLLQSCTPPRNRCEIFECMKVGSVLFKAYNKQTDRDLIDEYSPLQATDLRLDLYLEGEVGVCYKPEKRTDNWSLFSTAYATSPPQCKVSLGADSIVFHNITSDNNFDALHPAGSSLNDITIPDGYPVGPFFENKGAAKYPQCSFHINKSAADTGAHVFTIMLVDRAGDTTFASTPEIKLYP